MGDDVSVNPIYGDFSNPDSTQLDLVQSPGDRPTSMTMKSINNPNYESTLTLKSQHDKRASNPIYQAATELEQQNPLYEAGAGGADRGISNVDVNPLYEAGPVGSASGGSGSLADMNPLYQSAISYHSQCDFNPLYEGATDVSPLYEAAAPAVGKQSHDTKSSKARRRAKDDNASSSWPKDDEDGLGVVNRGADVTFNELYGSVEQTRSSPLGTEPDAPPVPPRQHAKRS